jgi:DNA repair exonuclease SbcCD nuclease subunit
VTARKRVRLLHTSDLHLGADSGRRGPAWHGPGCLCPIEIVGQAAVKSNCDVLIVAGDLFDHNRVDHELVGGLVRILGDLPIHTLLVPGNHDALDATSVYHRFERHAPSPRIHVAEDPLGGWTEFPECDLSVWGRPIVVHEPAYRPFGSPVPRRGSLTDVWHVAVAHGHFVEASAPHESTPRSSTFSTAELATVDADYVALGHWDIPTRVGDGRVPSWYSGSPTIGGTPRTAIVATLDPNDGVRVEHLPLETTGRDCGG